MQTLAARLAGTTGQPGQDLGRLDSSPPSVPSALQRDSSNTMCVCAALASPWPLPLQDMPPGGAWGGMGPPRNSSGVLAWGGHHDCPSYQNCQRIVLQSHQRAVHRLPSSACRVTHRVMHLMHPRQDPNTWDINTLFTSSYVQGYILNNIILLYIWLSCCIFGPAQVCDAKIVRPPMNAISIVMLCFCLGLRRMSRDAAGGGSAATQMARAAADNRKAELLETWLILEFCDQGSFDQAIRGGRFAGNLVGVPPSAYRGQISGFRSDWLGLRGEEGGAAGDLARPGVLRPGVL